MTIMAAPETRVRARAAHGAGGEDGLDEGAQAEVERAAADGEDRPEQSQLPR